jgi:triacylglycerol lipase
MQRPAPVYSLDFVLHPERDAAYQHFENALDNPFMPRPEDFPLVNVWWLTEAALLSYWSRETAIPAFEAARFQCEFIEKSGTECYVASQNEFVIVAFRGTQAGDWRDFLSDTNIVLASWQTGRVHLGFRTALNVIRPQLDPILQRLAPGRTLWFCGHSLGGALATLAADVYPNTTGVCTIGSPRVGDPAFADAFNAKFAGRSLRYVNDHDVVTHVPLPIGYEHVALRRSIAPDGSISDDPPAIPHFFADLIGEPAALLETVEALSVGILRTAPVFLLDHMPKAYAIQTWNDYDAHGRGES